MNLISSTVFLFLMYFGVVFEICNGSRNGCMSISNEPCSGFEHDGKCYILPGGKCRSSEDCISTMYSCQSKTCKSAEYTVNGEILSSKHGVSSYWIQHYTARMATEGVEAGMDQTMLLYVCRVSKDGATTPGKLLDSISKDCHAAVKDEETSENSYELLIGSNVEWATLSSHLDKAVYGGRAEDGSLYLICRTKHGDNYTVGKLQAPKFDECVYGYNWEIFRKNSFEVLVEK